MNLTTLRMVPVVPITSNKTSQDESLKLLLIELRNTIVALSSQCPSAVRMIMDDYLRLVVSNPPGDLESRLPVAVVPHTRFRERSLRDGTKYDLLIFYVGNAVLAITEYTGHPTNTLVTRIQHLRLLAEKQVSNFRVFEARGGGYYLGLSDAEQIEALPSVDEGGTNYPSSPDELYRRST